MIKTLLIVSDLVSRQQIKLVLPESIYIKDLIQLESELSDSSCERVLLDLTNNKLELAAVFKLLNKYNLTERTICFFPHVRSELAELAQENGLTQISPRSKFFNNLEKLLHD